jgi:hypothetical protein
MYVLLSKKHHHMMHVRLDEQVHMEDHIYGNENHHDLIEFPLLGSRMPTQYQTQQFCCSQLPLRPKHMPWSAVMSTLLAVGSGGPATSHCYFMCQVIMCKVANSCSREHCKFLCTSTTNQHQYDASLEIDVQNISRLHTAQCMLTVSDQSSKLSWQVHSQCCIDAGRLK